MILDIAYFCLVGSVISAPILFDGRPTKRTLTIVGMLVTMSASVVAANLLAV